MKLITILLLFITQLAFSKEPIKPHGKQGQVDPIYNNHVSIPVVSLEEWEATNGPIENERSDQLTSIPKGYYYDGLSRRWILIKQPKNYTAYYLIAGGILLLTVGYLLGNSKAKHTQNDGKQVQSIPSH